MLIFVTLVGVLLVGLAFLLNAPHELWEGSVTILTSPANLLTDYIEIANPGAALLNVGVMMLMSLGMIRANGVQLTGLLIAAVFTVGGFSFFGKNLLNSLPITIGVFLYAKVVGAPFKRYLPQALFGTALGPLVSEVCFNLGLPLMQGALLGMAAGVAAGFVIPPLAQQFSQFHQGYSLYNIGFTAGIVGMFFTAAIRGFGIAVLPVSLVSSGNNATFTLLLYALFAAIFLLGLFVNGWSLRGLRKILAESGRSCFDFLQSAGLGPVLINMALLGGLATSYVLVVGAELNGPTMGGIFTIVGFGAAGKHIWNVTPIILGVFVANLLNVYDHTTTASVVVALFGTTLAPIAGRYGFGYGVVAGVLHMGLTMNTGYLHGGMNLYNNGFSGAFIAAALVPLIENVFKNGGPRGNHPAPPPG